jgi:hypothetical protein
MSETKTPVKKDDPLFTRVIKALTPTQVLTKKISERQKALKDALKE